MTDFGPFAATFVGVLRRPRPRLSRPPHPVPSRPTPTEHVRVTKRTSRVPMVIVAVLVAAVVAATVYVVALG